MYNKENTEEAEKILGRISDELKCQGKTQASLVAFVDLPLGIYSSWKAGRSRSFCEHLGKISQFLGVSAEYLVTGEVAEGTIANNREQELVKAFRKLDKEKQEAVLQYVKWIEK